MQTLPNYGIKTAESTDNALNILDTIFDSNWQIVDTQLKLNEDAVAGVLANENNRIIAEDNRVSEFNALKTESGIATNNAINATTEANNAINDTIEATALANDATNTINITNNNIKIWEVFNPSKIYLPLNKTTYNGNSYECILQTTAGTYPNPNADTINWIKISGKGSDGVSSFVESKFTATSNNTTNIIHGLTYDSTKDNLQAFYSGYLLEKPINYTDNINGLSIDLVGWSINNGETITFKMLKGVTNSSLQNLIDQSTPLRLELDASVDIANSTKNALDVANTNNQIGTVSTLKTTVKNLTGAINENYDKLGVLSANGISENSLAEAIKNDRTQLAENVTQLEAMSNYLNYMPINGGDFDGLGNENVLIDGGTY